MLAVGSFNLPPFRSSVSFIPLCSILCTIPSLHFVTIHFTNLCTALQNQFLLFISQCRQKSLPCHGIPKALSQSLLTFGMLMPRQTPLVLLRCFQSLHLLLPISRLLQHKGNFREIFYTTFLDYKFELYIH